MPDPEGTQTREQAGDQQTSEVASLIEALAVEKGNADLAPCPICGEPRGDEDPCPHCGMD